MGRRRFRRQEKSLFNLPVSLLKGWRVYSKHRGDLQGLQRYCMFVGYPRSGHSLVGGLLNAHPEIVIAHELNALRYVRYGFPRSVLMGLLLGRDQEFGELGREWSGYDYSVPGQYQGRFTQLRVIGDKRGRASSKLLGRNPELLDALRDRVGVPIRVIHHVRNPFDNIATMARHGNESLAQAAERYFRFLRWTAAAFERLAPAERLDSYHEDFVDDPATELRRLTRFLGVDADGAYIQACCEKVFPSPRKSRDGFQWSPELTRSIEEQMAEFPHLAPYRRLATEAEAESTR